MSDPKTNPYYTVSDEAEELRTERDAYRAALERIAGVGLKAGAPRTLTAAGNLARAVLAGDHDQGAQT